VRLGRLYFGLQGLAGLAWWIAVFSLPSVRSTTLGSLPVSPIAVVDLPLFVGGSLLVAAGFRGAVWPVAVWTGLVTAALFLYATMTREAGWGFLLMTLALSGTILATLLILLGRIPTEWIITGPFVFRTTRDTKKGSHLARTARQLVTFWSFFLVLLPGIILLLERRWQLDFAFPQALRVIGLTAFLMGSFLGVWSSITMATLGEGTPLPANMAQHLVIAGPYRFVRNPMAVAGLVQGVSVGLVASSWLVVFYGLAGSAIWNWVVRPHEEADLITRFGEEFLEYQRRVACWLPRNLNRGG
jgi:protein-S-isoprenylcysteine O-methyltransferase Ste14